ncbi:HNH endonuclease [Trinickia sp.]|uniref:HNH endonuclease n=1 Tax=Trinickia sp. TaxID=2571163 RepID=UPI003F7EDF2B
MPRHRDPNIEASPFAHEWMRKHAEAASNLRRVIRLLLDHYIGDDHGYINRTANEVEYRFDPVVGDSISWTIQVVARAKHVIVRFPLYRPRKRRPWPSKPLKDAYGRDYHAVDIKVRCDDELTDLQVFIKTTKSFSGSSASIHRRRNPIGDALATAEQAIAAARSAIDSLEDARQRALQGVVVRRGQAKFRKALIEAYQGSCAVTGCTAVDVLEAAHIIPYLGEHSNRLDNGLLLRGDIHTLFDLGRLWIDADTMRICIADELRRTEYGTLHGRALKRPVIARWRPHEKHLRNHAETAKLAGAAST